jgi:hypothetical protein
VSAATVFTFHDGSLACLYIGRAYTMTGDAARETAQTFFKLWKDPDIAILKQAKVEYAKLYLGPDHMGNKLRHHGGTRTLWYGQRETERHSKDLGGWAGKDRSGSELGEGS